ncbi:MAG: DUF302 domain-containing protein [Caulobacter sp.]|nr:DUF302 domain-containing protein [Caulobacter sp.]
MSYYFSKMLDGPFDEAVVKVKAALAREGFGVISEIDIRQTLKTKIGVEFRPYLILGACNPALAHEALLLEDKVGLMLPCNVIIQEADDCLIEVAAIDPAASMQSIDNQALKAQATLVGEKLQAALEWL